MDCVDHVQLRTHIFHSLESAFSEGTVYLAGSITGLVVLQWFNSVHMFYMAPVMVPVLVSTDHVQFLAVSVCLAYYSTPLHSIARFRNAI